MFDGTNWIDPCDCNINIIDAYGVFKLIDPRGCVLNYFDGTSWCPITCPCVCPEGYTLNVATNACEITYIIPAVPSGGVTYDLEHGNTNGAYNTLGARLYEDISTKIFPINGWQDLTCGTGSGCYLPTDNSGLGSQLVIQQFSVPLNGIFDSQGSALKGRLNIAGLWGYNPTSFPVDEWLTVNYCINILEEKTYIFAISGDNQIKASITSTTFNGGGTTNLINLWGSDSPTGIPTSGIWTNPFKIWHMFPITLPVGSHILELSGMDFGTPVSFAGEIYDISQTDLMTMMASITVTPTDLEPYILFTTRDLVTVPPLLVAGPGEIITWRCPDSEPVDFCQGVPSCLITDSIPCDGGAPIDEFTEINIWFDNSGSMTSTLDPLEIMHATLLQTSLLPYYGNNVLLYNERVKVLNMFDGSWNYDERFVRCLATERNFNRSVDITVDQVINLTYSDESDVYGYGDTAMFNPTSFTTIYALDIAYLRTVMSTVGYTIKGTAFRVNTGPSAYPGFRELTRATFINNGAYTPPDNVNDYYAINFNCNLDTLAGSTPTYYKNQITASMAALGINIP